MINNKSVEKLKPIEIINFLSEPIRQLELECGIYLNICDKMGFRYWVLNNKTSEFQILFNADTIKKEFSLNCYDGIVNIENFEVSRSTTKHDVKNFFETIQDTDDLHKGINSLFLKYLQNCKLVFAQNDLKERT